MESNISHRVAPLDDVDIKEAEHHNGDEFRARMTRDYTGKSGPLSSIPQ